MILIVMGVIKKSVAMQMGWSSVAFMLENYARFLPGWGDNGAMDKALSCGPRTLSEKRLQRSPPGE